MLGGPVKAKGDVSRTPVSPSDRAWHRNRVLSLKGRTELGQKAL